MSNTPSFTPKEIASILKKNGFELDRSKGSHQIWINPLLRKRVVLPFHSKDLPIGTFYAILRQAGIDPHSI